MPCSSHPIDNEEVCCDICGDKVSISREELCEHIFCIYEDGGWMPVKDKEYSEALNKFIEKFQEESEVFQEEMIAWKAEEGSDLEELLMYYDNDFFDYMSKVYSHKEEVDDEGCVIHIYFK